MKADRLLKMLSYVAFPLFIGGMVLLAILFRSDLSVIFASPRALREWVGGFGAAAPLIFIAIQVMQVILFIIPGEIPQIAGGYLFGMWLGAAYSIIGIVIGSAFNFYLGRLLGIPFVQAVFGADRFSRFERVLSARRAMPAFFLLFLIPGVPKDALCYLAGLSTLGFPAFLLVSSVGRLPGILGSAAVGGAAARSMWLSVGFIIAAAVLLLVVGLLYRTQLHALVDRVIGGRRSDGGEK